MDLFPKQPAFFKAFEDHATLVAKIGELLAEVDFKSPKKLKLSVSKARKLENLADEICHKLYRQADSTFITPIDREDIQVLAKSLDNIVDLVEDVIVSFEVYHIRKGNKEFQEFSRLVRETTAEVLRLVKVLKQKGKNMSLLRKQIVKIHTLENEGDELFRRSLKSLFSTKDTKEIIKWKDIFEKLESVIDECEDTSDIIEAIVIKNF